MTDLHQSRSHSAPATTQHTVERHAPHDEEVYGTLGALLGTLEVIATDDQHPLSPQQAERMRGALRLGNDMQAQVEALLILADAQLGARLVRAHVAMRPLIEHAIRGALRSFEKGRVGLVLPSQPDWGQQRVLIDSSRVDRMLRALAERLAMRVGEGGMLEVSLEQPAAQVILTLRGRAGLVNERARLGSLVVQGARRLFDLHGGSLTSEPDGLTHVIALPASEAP